MTPLGNRLAATAALALFAAAPAGGPSLGWHPEEGRALERSFRRTTRFEVERLVERIGETELPDPLPALSGRLERELSVVDTPVGVGSGRADELRRRFVTVAGRVELEAELEGLAEDHAADLESPLEGEEALFRWDADEERHRAALVGDSEAARALVDGLREDLDLRALLPPGEEPAEGERWTVDAAALRELLAPGGELGLRFGYEPDGGRELVALEELTAISLLGPGDQAGELSGEVELEWTETRGEPGARLATIAIVLDAELAMDEAGGLELEARLDRSDLEVERRELRLLSTWTIEGRGRLVWDLDAGVFRELELELEHEARAVLSWTQDFGARELYYELELEVRGETDVRGECR